MAMQGKLVEQRPEEGNAKELLDSNNIEYLDKSDIKINIPTTWEFVHFGNLCSLRMGKTILKRELVDSGVPVYSATQEGNILGYLKECELKLRKGDLVIPARGNSIGFVKIVEDELATCTQTTICATDITCVIPELLFYICYAFKSVWFKVSGSAIPQVTVKQIQKFVVPVPPIEEQKRIVEKINQVVPLIKEYGKLEEEREALDKELPEKLKKSILQYAMQGKLVPQILSEGTAEELYAQIQEEKQKLIAEGKLKKEKPLPPITEDEIPFQIPPTWKWVRSNEIFTYQQGVQIDREEQKNKKFDGSIKFLRIINFTQKDNDFRYVSKNFINPSAMINSDDLVMVRYGATAGYIFYGSEGLLANNLFKIISPTKVDKNYIMLYYKNNWVYQAIISDKSDTAMPSINFTSMRKVPFPLPPYNEQKRIVELVQLLASIIKQIEFKEYI